MRSEGISVSSRRFAGNARTAIAGILALLLVFGHSAAVKADWKSDANARIEQIRKRNAEIAVVDPVGNPVPGLNVQIEQVKHRFAFGTCVAFWPLYSNSSYRDFILDHFEWAVCENETKWAANESSRDSESYTQADYIYDWCNNNGITMRGHTLFWEQWTYVQSWVQGLSYATYPTSSDLLSEVDERIDSAVNHFKGKFRHWDVDNEMLTDSFYNRLGEAGRVHMFQRANTVDPNCKLYMNEYSGNSFGGYDGWTYASRANSLISSGAPIHGIGIQGHINSPFDPERYWTNVLEPLRTGVGLPILVTEFDVPQADENLRADDLENFYRICFSHPSVEGILMWGFWQDSAWRWQGIVNTDWTINAAGVRYESLMDEWTTNDANTTDSAGNVSFRGFHGTYQITLSVPGEPNEIHTIEMEPGTTAAQFVLETNIAPLLPDTTPPTPNPMTWSIVPTATGPYSISMTASTAFDTSGVEYYFDCLTAGGHDSGWQNSTTYQDTGLNPSTSYAYRVKARDKSPNQNETGWSSSQSATTTKPPKYSGGSGTLADPYRIATAEDLNNIGNYPADFGKYFLMTDNIDLAGYSGSQFNFIGKSGSPFTGVFDGNNHTISNLAYTGGGQKGLFGIIEGKAVQIKNVVLVNSFVDGRGGGDTGSLVGLMNNGKISNCRVVNCDILGDSQVGGLAGTVSAGTITRCEVSGLVYGGQSVGGLAGWNAGTIIDCRADCSVSGLGLVGGLAGRSAASGKISTSCSTSNVAGGDYAGGLVGYLDGPEIRNCYSAGQVSGGGYVGGLVGYYAYSAGTVSRCYSAASVSGTTNVGGLIGYVLYGGVSASFWDVDASGQSISAKGAGKTTTEMMKRSTFTKAGWDFVWESKNGTKDIWWMCEGNGYPTLTWQSSYYNTDSDETVDFTYLAPLGLKWMQADSSRCAGGADLTGDEWVDLDDLVVIAEYWLRKRGCLDYSGEPPAVSIVSFKAKAVFADRVVLAAKTTPDNQAETVYFHLREPNKGAGIPIGYEGLRSDFNDTAGQWEYKLDTAGIPDGKYIVVAEATNECGSGAYGKPLPMVIANNILVAKCTVKAGSKANSDSIYISGLAGATDDDFSGTNVVEISVDSEYMGPFALSFPITEKTYRKGKFSYSATENGVRRTFKYNVKTHKFALKAQKADLLGLSCPMTVQMTVGDKVNVIDLDETIVNGLKRPIPIKLMMGVDDSLRVDKFRVRRGKKPNTDQLLVRGGFAVANRDINMVTPDFVVTLGTIQTFTIPAGSFYPNARKDRFACKKAGITEAEGGIAAANFNFRTCTFTLTIKNTKILAGPGDAEFNLEFGPDFEGQQVELPP